MINKFLNMHLQRYLIALTALNIALIAGCSSESNNVTQGQNDESVVYVCTETDEAFLAGVQQTPALHPKTGKRSLMLGMYCSGCKKWRPAPPMDVLQHSPGSAACPIHKTSMNFDGPKAGLPH